MYNKVMKNFNFNGRNYICKKCGKKVEKVLISSSVVEWELDGYKKIKPVIKENSQVTLKCECGNKENIHNMVLNHPDYLHFIGKQEIKCTACSGSGYYARKPCGTCDGTGIEIIYKN